MLRYRFSLALLALSTNFMKLVLLGLLLVAAPAAAFEPLNTDDAGTVVAGVTRLSNTISSLTEQVGHKQLISLLQAKNIQALQMLEPTLSPTHVALAIQLKPLCQPPITLNRTAVFQGLQTMSLQQSGAFMKMT